MEQLEEVNPEEILLAGSSHASVEENYALAKFANLHGYRKPVFIRNEEKGKADGFLLTDDLAPNTNGCIILGFDELTPDEFSAEADKDGLIILVNDDIFYREEL